MNNSPKVKKRPGKNQKSAAIKSKERSGLSKFFEHFSSAVTRVTGGVYAFIFAIVIVIIWAATGPVFHYSDTWQLVINTGTTIVTFLMVFVIQHSQNKDTIALQLKLNELIAASQASNKLIDVEELSDEELAKLKSFYADLSSLTKKEKENRIHSIEEQRDELEAVDEGKNVSDKKKNK
jgi:low affinity Fe/Cu permease